MPETIDPEWTDKVDFGRILDPLQLNRVRNRMLNHMLYGIVSVAITQRLRYISFSLWCLNNLDEPTKDDIVPLEKIFVLANVAHDHEGQNDRDERGLSGRDNVPWSSEELRNSDNSSFSISNEKFRIQKGNSTAFSQYYRGITQHLLLTENGYDVTTLGRKVAEAYGKAVKVDFEDLKDAANQEQVSKQTILELAKSGCGCEISSEEKELLTKTYLGLISSATRYDQLSFSSLDQVDAFELEAILAEEDAPEVEDLLEEEDANQFLEKFFFGQSSAKMRESLMLFLWVAKQQETESYDAISNFNQFNQIRELWRMQLYYSYFVYACETMLFATLWTLRSRNSLYPEQLLESITQNPAFGKAVKDAINSINSETADSNNGLDTAFQYFYYGKPSEERSVSVEEGEDSYEGTWQNLQNNIREHIDVSELSADEKITEWKLKQLIENEVGNTSSDPEESSARIFGYVAVLLALLRLRYDEFFSKEEYSQYRNWISKVEESSDGLDSLLESLEGDDDLDQFIQDFSYCWVIKQHNEAVYSKMGSSRMPRLFSQDFNGRIDFQQTGYTDGWSSSLSEIKFKRMVDVMYELGLIENDGFDDFQTTERGKSILSQFMEVSE